MKVLAIALKDLVRSYRSAFLLVMMFVAPLLITGLIYLAFGRSGGGLNLPQTRVVVANLDKSDASSGLAAGKLLAGALVSPELAELLAVTAAPDEASARALVDGRAADVAVIIPPDFTATLIAGQRDLATSVVVYHDPTLTLQPQIVGVVVGDIVEGLSGARIAVDVASAGMAQQGLPEDHAALTETVRRYTAWLDNTRDQSGAPATQPVAVLRTPEGEVQAADLRSTLLGPVMAGMLVFFAFFTGAYGVSSILTEDESGTLARLFTTPTPRSGILSGKMLAVLLTVIGQALVLVIVSTLIFGISWGNPLSIGLATLGLAIAATGFGALLISFIRTSRQSGPVLGAAVTLTGMLGGLIPTGDPTQPGAFEKMGLLLPQGWAVLSWKLSLAGAGPAELLMPVAVTIAYGLVLFAIGLVGFRRRYA